MGEITKRLELKITVDYIPNGVSTHVLETLLAMAAMREIGNGGLTGDTPAEVDWYAVSITELN